MDYRLTRSERYRRRVNAFGRRWPKVERMINRMRINGAIVGYAAFKHRKADLVEQLVSAFGLPASVFDSSNSSKVAAETQAQVLNDKLKRIARLL